MLRLFKYVCRRRRQPARRQSSSISGASPYIDSAGLGVLVSAHKRFESSGATLVIRQLNERIMRIFTVSGLSNYLNIKK